jgi:N utilization substance protein A
VQAIIRELRGEKIDIVEWSEDPTIFVTNAISPARVQRVTVVDDAERVLEVVVEDRQLSLAIGKKGQNVRLAAKLTGWKIDIKSEEEKRREVEAQFDGLAAEEAATLTLPGLDDDQLRKLSASGFDTADRLLEATTAELAELLDVDADAVDQLQAEVREQVEAAERAATEAAEAAEAVEEKQPEEATPTTEASVEVASEEPKPEESETTEQTDKDSDGDGQTEDAVTSDDKQSPS